MSAIINRIISTALLASYVNYAANNMKVSVTVDLDEITKQMLSGKAEKRLLSLADHETNYHKKLTATECVELEDNGKIPGGLGL